MWAVRLICESKARGRRDRYGGLMEVCDYFYDDNINEIYTLTQREALEIDQ